MLASVRPLTRRQTLGASNLLCSSSASSLPSSHPVLPTVVLAAQPHTVQQARGVIAGFFDFPVRWPCLLCSSHNPAIHCLASRARPRSTSPRSTAHALIAHIKSRHHSIPSHTGLPEHGEPSIPRTHGGGAAAPGPWDPPPAAAGRGPTTGSSSSSVARPPGEGRGRELEARPAGTSATVETSHGVREGRVGGGNGRGRGGRRCHRHHHATSLCLFRDAVRDGCQAETLFAILVLLSAIGHGREGSDCRRSAWCGRGQPLPTPKLLGTPLQPLNDAVVAERGV